MYAVSLSSIPDFHPDSVGNYHSFALRTPIGYACSCNICFLLHFFSMPGIIPAGSHLANYGQSNPDILKHNGTLEKNTAYHYRIQEIRRSDISLIARQALRMQQPAPEAQHPAVIAGVTNKYGTRIHEIK